MTRYALSTLLSAALLATALAGPALAQAQMPGGGEEGWPGSPGWTPGTPPHWPDGLQGTGQQPGWNGGPHAGLGSPQNVGGPGSPRQPSTAPTKLSPPAGEWTPPTPSPAPPQSAGGPAPQPPAHRAPKEARSGSLEMWMGQERKPPTQGDETYRSRTLDTGAFTAGAAQMAQQHASNPNVKEFARLELAEQAVVTDVLAHGSTASPPTTDPAHAAQLRQLQAAGPQEFDRAFVKLEIAGHEEALQAQQQYLAGGATDPDLVHIAKLEQATIREHLALLQGLQASLGGPEQTAHR